MLETASNGGKLVRSRLEGMMDTVGELIGGVTKVPTLVTPELSRRRSRPPDYEAENRALVALAEHLATSPTDILQRLVHATLDLCRAGSAGISMLEDEHGSAIFRWSAIAGQLSPYLSGTTPRHFSPCGIVLDLAAVQLFDRPGRDFPYLDEAPPRIVEALLQPFCLKGEPTGTLWVISHDDERKFDSEDARVLESLAKFSSNAYQVLLLLQTLREADQRKDEFLGMLSHEMRSPLNATATWLRALRLGDGDPKVRERAYASIARSVTAQARLVGDLLDSARIYSGKLSIDVQDADLAVIVRDAFEVAAPSAAQKRVTLESRADAESIPIRADAVRVEQVIANLLANAIKFTPAGGTIGIETRLHDRECEIVVSDNGEGISAEALPFIFERFRQGDGSTTRRHGGLGLGLAIARYIVEMHGGTIEGESDGLLKGATFRVRLPLVSRFTDSRSAEAYDPSGPSNAPAPGRP